MQWMKPAINGKKKQKTRLFHNSESPENILNVISQRQCSRRYIVMKNYTA